MVRMLFALVVMLSTNASAAEWNLFEKRDGVNSYLDLDSLRVNEDMYTVWLKSQYAKPQKMRQKPPGGTYSQKLELVHMECSQRSYHVEKSIYSTEDGTPVATKKDENGFETVVPDSPSEVIYTAICKRSDVKFRALSNQGIRYSPLKEEPKWWNPFAK